MRTAILALTMLACHLHPPQTRPVNTQTDLGKAYADIVQDRRTPASERVRRGVAYLKREIEHPSPTLMGLGGDITSGYILMNVAGMTAFPACEAVPTLRQEMRQTTSPRLKDVLLLVYGLTGAPATIPDLLRLGRSDPEPYLRILAMRALFRVGSEQSIGGLPKRLFPEQKWRPFTPKEQKAILTLYLDSLADAFAANRYEGVGNFDPIDYPVQNQARENLRNMGYTVTKTESGRRVTDQNGQVREVTFKRTR